MLAKNKKAHRPTLTLSHSTQINCMNEWVNVEQILIKLHHKTEKKNKEVKKIFFLNWKKKLKKKFERKWKKNKQTYFTAWLLGRLYNNVFSI